MTILSQQADAQSRMDRQTSPVANFSRLHLVGFENDPYPAHWPSCSCFADLFRDVPDLVGDIYRPGMASSTVFRPVATLPPAATGAAVLDVANNRLVYVDGTNTLLAPGNAGLGNSFVFFRAPGGGLLTQTTNALGQTGYFGLERLTTDATRE
jgi:hypothetical protein